MSCEALLRFRLELVLAFAVLSIRMPTSNVEVRSLAYASL